MVDMRTNQPVACVMGSMDLVRPLGMAGIRCVAITEPGSAPLYSRFVDAAIHCKDFWAGTAGLAEALVQFGASRSIPPVLFYEQDSHLLFVSRHRDQLSQAFRFVAADAALVEDLVDKGRFQALVERLRLPVPATHRVHPATGSEPAHLDLRFPVVVKSLTRREKWDAVGGAAKALEVATPEALRILWPHLAEAGVEFVVQEMIPGPETRIESYHVYIDARGDVAAEFTGRKIRTYPVSCGHSTALTITDAADVVALGRSLAEKLGLRGVAKFDFKRGPDDRLHLLEVNPRFNMWHHLGAVAGVNLPAIVYADMVGAPRPAASRARIGACWCTLSTDRRAAKAIGVPMRSWLPWAFRCEAKSVVAWDDPMPYLRSKLSGWLSRRGGAEAPAHPAPLEGRTGT